MFSWWRSRRQSRPRDPHARRFWPRLEILEDRCLLAPLTVLNTNDSGAGSLRAAILQANSDPTPDTILFDPSLAGQTVLLSTANSTPLISSTTGEDFALGPSAFAITNAITIDGGSGGITIARDPKAPAFRLFQVYNPDDLAAASLTLKNVTLSGGLAQGGNGTNGGGGGGGAAGLGGAVLNLGTLALDGVTFKDNQALGGNGGKGVGASLLPTGQPMFPGGGGGGGLDNSSAGGIIRVSFPGQGGDGGGPNGGLGGFGPGANGQDGGGGAGGASFQGGAGGDAVSTLGLGGGGGGAGAAPVGSRGGNGDFGGGGGGGAGGFFGTDPGGSGGFGGGSGGQGAGSDIIANAIGGGGGGGAGLGGAIFNRGTLTVINSTFEGNRATGGNGGNDSKGNPSGGKGAGLGGAVFTWDSTASFVNDTLASNTASTITGQDLYNLQLTFNGSTPPANLNLVNDIVDISLIDLVNNNGTVTGSNNLVSSQSGVPAAVIVSTTDPLLGPLQDNGGPTPTMELLAGSPALNTGTPTGAPATDQRGVLRGASIDIGAYQAAPAALSLSGFPNPTVSGKPGTFTVTASPVDVFGKTVFDFSDPVVFSATGQASTPDRTILNGGSGTFSATLFSPGQQVLTVTDPILGIRGSQVVIVFAPADSGQPPPKTVIVNPPGSGGNQFGFGGFGGSGGFGNPILTNPGGPGTPVTPTNPVTPSAPPIVISSGRAPGGGSIAGDTSSFITAAPVAGGSAGQQVIVVTVPSAASSEVAAAIILGRTGTMQAGSQAGATQGATGGSNSIAAMNAAAISKAIAALSGEAGVEGDDAKELADLTGTPRRGADTLLVVPVSFEASLGSAFSSQDGGHGLPLSISLSEGNGGGGTTTPFSKILQSAAEGDAELSLLLFRLEGKPLRIGSSLADADDSVLLVEALVGPAGATIIEVPVVRTPATTVEHAPVVRADERKDEGKTEGEPAQPAAGVYVWAAAGGLVVVVVVVCWWGWRPVARPVNQTVR